MRLFWAAIRCFAAALSTAGCALFGVVVAGGAEATSFSFAFNESIWLCIWLIVALISASWETPWLEALGCRYAWPTVKPTPTINTTTAAMNQAVAWRAGTCFLGSSPVGIAFFVHLKPPDTLCSCKTRATDSTAWEWHPWASRGSMRHIAWCMPWAEESSRLASLVPAVSKPIQSQKWAFGRGTQSWKIVLDSVHRFSRRNSRNGRGVLCRNSCFTVSLSHPKEVTLSDGFSWRQKTLWSSCSTCRELGKAIKMVAIPEFDTWPHESFARNYFRSIATLRQKESDGE